MLNKIFNFFKHPVITVYNAGVQLLEKHAAKTIRKKLKDMDSNRLDARIEQYHAAGYMNRDIAKHIKAREKANKMNEKAGGVLNELSLLPSLTYVSEDKQKEQINVRSSVSFILEAYRYSLNESIHTIMLRVNSVGVDPVIIKKFLKAFYAADTSEINSFYHRNKSDFESMFVKYLGDINDVEEALKTWTEELS